MLASNGSYVSVSKLLIALQVALACLWMCGAPVLAQTPGTFALTGSMSTPRLAHTATLLANGQVLVAGGVQSPGHVAGLQSAEIYDPALGQFTPTGNLNQGRADATAVRLANGQVLVVGGDSSGFFLTSAEIFDPARGMFTATGSMNTTHQFVPAILLNNGKVLIAGCASSPPTPTAELYDPATGTFTPTAGAMIVNRCQYASAPLPDGRILFAGADASAEIYNPSTDSFSPTGSMNMARDAAAAAPLPDGRILISGGQSPIFNSAEIYDPASGSFSFTSNMTTYRTQHTAIALSDGEILLALGYDQSGISTSAELYHPSVEEFFSTGSLTQQRPFGTATLLANGQVLFAGGEDSSNTAIVSAELYTPSPVWIPFSSFAANAQIHAGKKPSFNLYATAMPAANGYAINPAAQNVYLALGTYSATIPSGSFAYDPKHGLYNFSGVIENVALEVSIQPLTGGTFSLSVTANGFDLSGNSNPILVELHVGGDVGKMTIAARFVS